MVKASANQASSNRTSQATPCPGSLSLTRCSRLKAYSPSGGTSLFIYKTMLTLVIDRRHPVKKDYSSLKTCLSPKEFAYVSLLHDRYKHRTDALEQVLEKLRAWSIVNKYGTYETYLSFLRFVRENAKSESPNARNIHVSNT